MAFNGKRAALAAGNASGGSLAPLWNSLVFSKVKAKLGGRVRILTTGASPISADVMAFMRVCFPGATVLEGYGALPCSPWTQPAKLEASTAVTHSNGTTAPSRESFPALRTRLIRLQSTVKPLYTGHQIHSKNRQV